MKFQRVYIEITNICGLSCDFCPQKNSSSHIMPLHFFKTLLIQLQTYTKEIYLHVLGDPLTLSNLKEYLDLAHQYNFKVNITTSGAYLQNHLNIFHPALKQINISLNSFNKNSFSISFDEYMQTIFRLYENRKSHSSFINLRLWNLDKSNTEEEFNQKVFNSLEKYFNITIQKDVEKPYIRLASKVLLHFDNYFQWPSLKSAHHSHSYCHGLNSQIAILSDGTVTPCCLDSDGTIALGNLNIHSLDEILLTKRVHTIKECFKKGIAYEKLCQKCSFKDRFKRVL